MWDEPETNLDASDFLDCLEARMGGCGYLPALRGWRSPRELVREAQRLRRRSLEGHQRSLRDVAAELARAIAAFSTKIPRRKAPMIIAAFCCGMVRRTHQPCTKTPCTNVCSARDTINPENSLARSYDEAASEKWHASGLRR
jgi:hypothetical protein